MVEKLTGAIAEKIRGLGYEVYTESVHQNLKKPCAFVQCENAERVELLNGKFFIRVKIRVDFMAEGDEKTRMEEEAVGLIFGLLGRVYVGEAVFNGRKINSENDNGRLSVFALYDIWTKETEDENSPLMEAITIRERYDGRE